MSEQVGDHPIFKSWTERSVAWGPGGTWSAAFGGNVLGTVTSGLDDHLASWRSPRTWSAILGCVPWLSDAPVVDRLLRFRASCIVINKPDRLGAEPGQVRRLHDEGPGFPAVALPEFHWLAPREDGKPAMIGPHDHPTPQGFESVRVAGVSRQQRTAVPLVHAKLLLLGECGESENDFGESVIYFEPQKAWLGSANLTVNSRRSLEFGLWTNDPSLLDLVSRFLTDLLSYSELLDSYQLNAEPERIRYEFDDAAMYEYLIEHGTEPDDEG